MAGERPNHLEHPNFSRGLVEVPLFKVPLDFEYHGKVRDVYGVNDRLAIITTDRTSANDERVCTIPDKGKVLNGLSAFWFDQTSDIIQNHVIDVPHPNVTIATRVDERPAVEVVVREYMAVSNTDTSIFKNYKNGRRTIYGINFPDGLQANQKFDERIVTPTTKAEDGEHDKELTDEKAKALVDGQYGWGAWDHMKDTALALFDRGSDIYSDRGLILVDTKFEFGFKDGQLMLIDEALTPDSSRLWEAATYEERHKNGLKPENLDKQIIRDALHKAEYEMDGIPLLPAEIIDAAGDAYKLLYERVTGHSVDPTPSNVFNIQLAALQGLNVTV